MIRILVAFSLFMLTCVGCQAAFSQTDWTPLIATEAALVTMVQPDLPEPEPEVQPDDSGDVAEPMTGPLDTLRDAKELVRKGNDLADRGKAMLDQAEQDGKITVDIRLPNPELVAATCSTGSCSRVSTGNRSSPAYRSSATRRRTTSRRPLLFWRWRR